MQVSRPQSKQPMPSHAQRVFKGKIFDVYQWEQVGFNGKAYTFEKIKRPDTVHIFAVTEQGNIVVSREQQPGTEEYITPPGGRVDEGEDALTAAKRELLEETGYVSDDWDLLDAWQMHPKLEWAIFAFVARNVKKDSVDAKSELENDERITNIEVSFDKLVEIVSSRDFYDRELRCKFLEAKLDPQKMVELRNKILGT